MDAPTFQLEKPTADYTMVCNALLRDRSISLRAKGLYALMFSKPSGWIFHEAALQAESSEGRDALRAAMKELLVRGWVQKCRPREEGKFAGVIYRMMLTSDWKTVDGLTVAGKSTSNNTDITNTEEPIPPTPKGEPDGFEEFWSEYPNKVGKPKAGAAWKRVKADHVEVMLGLRRWKASEQWTKDKGKFVPHPTTWLNREGWNDAIAGEGAAVVSAADIEASRKRQEASERDYQERIKAAQESRRREFGMAP